MIEVNKLNGAIVYVNPDLIRYLEDAGDTVLVFTDGEKLLVRQSPDDVIARIVSFRKRCEGGPEARPIGASGF